MKLLDFGRRRDVSSMFVRRAFRHSARCVPLLIVLAAAVAYRAELAAAIEATLACGWPVLLVFPLFLVWNYAAALGWRELVRVTGGPRAASAYKLSIIRIQALAVNLILPLGNLSGEVTRSTLLTGSRADLAHSASSVVLDLTSSTVAGILFAFVGLSLKLASIPLGRTALTLWSCAGIVLLSALLCLPGVISAVSPGHRIRKWPAAARFLDAFKAAGNGLRPAFHRAVIWHLAERFLMAGEIWLISAELAKPLDIPQTLFAAAVLTCASTVFFFVPSQLGAAEGGLALAFSLLGMAPSTGLAVALVRRGRQFVVCAAGLTILSMNNDRAALLRPGRRTDALGRRERKEESTKGGGT